MFWDEEYIEEKMEDLKDMIENNTFDKSRCNNFISYDELESDFTHTEIEYAQEIFIQKAKEYLSRYPKQYAIWCDWCVHVSTVGLYKEIMWENNNYREEYRKIRESRDIV